MNSLFYGRRLTGSSRSYLVVNYIPMLKIVNSSESLPAVPEQIVEQRFSGLPQRTDYVPPVPKHTDFIEADTNELMAINKFLEVNAVMPEHWELADRLRAVLEGR